MKCSRFAEEQVAFALKYCLEGLQVRMRGESAQQFDMLGIRAYG
ncbi:MAG: hypothetical protein OEM32_09960 [Acidimicrobiia bacterium]|nr:hypothetical protein [Acidimicrobiia bacterium]